MISGSIFPGLFFLSKAFYGLFLLALAASIFPFASSVPLWILRLSDAFVSNAPVLLVSLALLLLGHHFQDVDDYSKIDVKYLIVRRLGSWAIICMLIIPLQFVGYSWFWLDSGTRLEQQMGQAGNRLESLKQRLRASNSEVELQRVMAGFGRHLGQATEGSLKAKKQDAIKSLEADYQKLKSGLTDQRNKTLADLLPGVLRNGIGTIIIYSALKALRRQFKIS